MGWKIPGWDHHALRPFSLEAAPAPANPPSHFDAMHEAEGSAADAEILAHGNAVSDAKVHLIAGDRVRPRGRVIGVP